MNNRTELFFQAIRGPVLLMTVGGLFALQQTGYVSVWRTWPVVLIVIGIMKLLERAARPNTPVAPNIAAGTNGGQPR